MSYVTARISLIALVWAVMVLPETADGGLFRRRCRHQRQCTKSVSDENRVPTSVTGCASGSVCVQKLTAKYLDATGKCVYATYDAVRCPTIATTHYDSNCGYQCPKYCNVSPCACISRSLIAAMPFYAESARDQSYTATIELLTRGLSAEIASEEYPGAKKVSEYVIELEKDKKVKIIWLKISPGRYSGTGYLVSDSTPISRDTIVHTAKRITLDKNKKTKAFQVAVEKINEVNVDQDYLVLVDY